MDLGDGAVMEDPDSRLPCHFGHLQREFHRIERKADGRMNRRMKIGAVEPLFDHSRLVEKLCRKAVAPLILLAIIFHLGDGRGVVRGIGVPFGVPVDVEAMAVLWSPRRDRPRLVRRRNRSWRPLLHSAVRYGHR